MAASLNLSTHRHWEDWCLMGVGAVVLISPAIAQMIDWPYVTLKAVLVGMLAIWLAGQELMLPETKGEYLGLGQRLADGEHK